jgi:ferritin
MIKKKLQDAINAQVKHELYSAYYYLSMSAFCESINLPGFAHWMKQQYEEETAHAMRLYHFLLDRGGKVELQAIAQPPHDFESPVKVFEAVLAHEQKVTALIHKLYELALKEGDYPTQVEMQWFITEQVEEEKNAGDIVQQIKLAGDNNTAILMLDRELGARVSDDEE